MVGNHESWTIFFKEAFKENMVNCLKKSLKSDAGIIMSDEEFKIFIKEILKEIMIILWRNLLKLWLENHESWTVFFQSSKKLW